MMREATAQPRLLASNTETRLSRTQREKPIGYSMLLLYLVDVIRLLLVLVVVTYSSSSTHTQAKREQRASSYKLALHWIRCVCA